MSHLDVIALTLAMISLLGFLLITIRLYSIDVELQAMKKSTHKIQYMPIDPGWAQSESELNKAFDAADGGGRAEYEGVE